MPTSQLNNVSHGRGGTYSPAPPTVGDYLITFHRYRWLIALLLLVGLVVGGGLMLLRPRLYEAWATVAVSSSKLGSEQTALPPNVTGFRVLLENRQIAAQVIREFHLDGPPARLTPLSFVTGRLTVEELRGTSLLIARVRLEDASMAAAVTNRLVDLAVELIRRTNLNESQQSQTIVKQQLDASVERRRSAERRLAEFQRTAQLDIARGEADALLAQRDEIPVLAVDIETERAKIAAAEAQLAREPRVLADPRAVDTSAALLQMTTTEEPRPVMPKRLEKPVQSLESSAPADERDRRDDRTPRSDAQERRQTNGSNAPRNAEKQGEGTNASDRPTLRREPAAKVNPPPEPPPSNGLDLRQPFINPVHEVLAYQLALSRTKLASLEQRMTTLRARRGAAGSTAPLTKLYEDEITLARMQADVSLAASIEADLARRYDQARLLVASRASELQVVDPALVPEQPMSRGVVRGAALGGAAGLITAVLLAFALQYAAEGPRSELS